MRLTAREEDCLMALGMTEGALTLSKLASRLGVRQPTAFDIVKRLEKKALVTHQKYGDIRLTDEGARISRELISRHTLIKNFLIEILTIPEEIAEKDAHTIEHHLQPETLERMTLLLKFISTCSGGKPNFVRHFREYVSTGKCPENCKNHSSST